MEKHRGALNLLSVYGDGDSSEDDVPGCRVSTKRSHKHSNDDEDQNHKRLPFPDVLKFETTEAVADDPLEHNGRVRTFPHERGNWATYVFVPCSWTDGIQELTRKIVSQYHNLTPMDRLHISLTKVVVLRHHWIESFMQSVRQRLSNTKSFLVMFDCLKVFCNEERTRTFIAFETNTGHDSLQSIADGLDKCLEEFRLPGFYKSPSFHVSLAWCVGDQEGPINEVLPELNRIVSHMMVKFTQDNWYVLVEHLECKTGNKLFKFSLQK